MTIAPGGVTLRVAAPLSDPRYTVGFMEQPGELVGRALVVVVDDRTAHGEEDHSGPLVTELLGEAGFVVDGAKIVEVTGGGAAAAAGLPSGVVVTKVDDRVIGSADALVAAVRSRAPGEKVTLTYLDASGKPQTVQVTLGKAQQ